MFILRVEGWRSDREWRWVLCDGEGDFLADHAVAFAPAPPELAALLDLPAHLTRRAPIREPVEEAAALAAWMREKLLGRVGEVLAEGAGSPGPVVRVELPAPALRLLDYPWELALQPRRDRPGEGGAAPTLIYELSGPPRPDTLKPEEGPLRVLAFFSLPHGEHPLNLRRERAELARLLNGLAADHRAAIELSVLQYGATRARLAEALSSRPGWDLIHLSGHGAEGELVLEDETGAPEIVTVAELVALFRPTRPRLKLLTLSACLSGAGTVASARQAVGLPPLDGPAAAESHPLSLPVLPSLGQQLAAALDCAVVAMRYSVEDGFARRLALGLYERLLGHGQPLPEALAGALAAALAVASTPPPLAAATPILLSRRAATLRLRLPPGDPSPSRAAGLLEAFPPPPERLVGRLRELLGASRALAPQSRFRGVLFHGLAGGGKSQCALELAHLHAEGRFEAAVWWQAPDEGRDLGGAFADLALAIEQQLPGVELVGLVDDLDCFCDQALPRLRRLLEEQAILFALDNLESLVTAAGHWQDERWQRWMDLLLSHAGPSRAILTSRRVPVDLDAAPTVLLQPVHALSFPESVLLAEELPHLGPLFDVSQGRALLRRILGMAQGHPKLLDLADRLLVADRALLDKQLGSHPPSFAATESFFTAGKSRETPESFLATLERWALAVAERLPEAARKLFGLLACLEGADRRVEVVEVLGRRLLAEPAPPGTTARADPAAVSAGLELLQRFGLVELDGGRLRLHPAVARAGREAVGADFEALVCFHAAGFFLALLELAEEWEAAGQGHHIVPASVAAARYLVRQEDWEGAAKALGPGLLRDPSPRHLALCLPLLERIVRAVRAREGPTLLAALLGTALVRAGRFAEAEPLLEEALRVARRQGDTHVAHSITQEWANLLLARGDCAAALARLDAALSEAASDPWMALALEVTRAQALHRLGAYEDVLAVVGTLRQRLAGLLAAGQRSPLEIHPWDLLETLLDTGRAAAATLERWEVALALNQELVASRETRHAETPVLAQAQLNDFWPLAALGRFEEAQRLLDECQAIFEAVQDLWRLSTLFSARARLEHDQGRAGTAAAFEMVALRYSYAVERPLECAISHLSLGDYLLSSGDEDGRARPHLLAALVLFRLTGDGLLEAAIDQAAAAFTGSEEPTLTAVVQQVEAIEGVRFRALLDALPPTTGGAEAALAEIWARLKAAP
jgi:tetratricopeptide (TPR) repeat protein